jgi:CheY-like chemotaxis protein
MGFQQLIVGLTGNVLEDDVREFLLAGADMVLGKPLEIRKLQVLLHHIENYGTVSQWPQTLQEVSECRLDWVFV